MDASELADAIDGFAEFLDSLAHSTYGSDVKIRLVVRTARPGTFDIQFLFEAAALANTVFSTLGPSSVSDMIKQAFDLLKHLKGEAPKNVKTADHGSVYVENNSGQIIVINRPVLHAVIDGHASQGAERFARRPLQAEAEQVEVSVNGEITAKADRESAQFFVPIRKGDILAEFEAEQYLTIQTVVLEGDGLWRFSDGRNKFRAEVTDKDFLQRVNEGRERFGRGDILRVRLRSKQEKVKGKLRTTHVIEKVLSHEPYRGGQTSFLQAG